MNSKPINLIVIKADELRADSLGCAGNPAVKTPNLDRLAEQGMRFESAFTASTLCVPSRASFFTGQYVHAHRGVGNGPMHHVSLDQVALPQMMKEAGYVTALCGKNHAFQGAYCDQWFDVREEYSHWGKSHGEIRDSDKKVADHRHNDWRPGFGNFGLSTNAVLGEGLIEDPEPFPEEQCMTYRIAEDSVDFVKANADKPFFLHMSFPDPHWPNTVCDPYYSMYEPEDLPALEAWPMEWTGHPFKHFVQSRACGNDKYTELERKRILATYYGQVSFIDKAVGMLLDEIQRLGLSDNTLILFTADHGSFAGRYGLTGKTGGFMDALLKIPLIMQGPGIAADVTTSAMVSNIDVLPTLCDVLGLAIPDSVQGRSFAGCLQDSDCRHRDAIFAEVGDPKPPPAPVPMSTYDEYNRERTDKDGWFWFIEYASHGRSAVVRTGRWKYAFYVGDCDELYDLEEDPMEVNNLAESPEFAPAKQELRDRLFAWLLSAPFGVEPQA